MDEKIPQELCTHGYTYKVFGNWSAFRPAYWVERCYICNKVFGYKDLGEPPLLNRLESLNVDLAFERERYLAALSASRAVVRAAEYKDIECLIMNAQ